MSHVIRRDTTAGYRYDACYRAPDGKERSTTFRTRKEAERFLAATMTDLDRGAWADPRGRARKFAAVADEWLSSNPAKRASSWARDELVIRVHLNPVLGDRSVGGLTPVEIQQLVTGWSKTMAPRSTRRVYSTLSSVLTYAVGHDILVRSPCRGIKLPKVEPTERPLLGVADVVALADTIAPDYAPMVYLGAVLGLRWGECAGLRVGRVDFLGGTLTVAEQLTRGRYGEPTTGPPKSHAGRRTLAVPAALMSILTAHLGRRGLTGADRDAFVFSSPTGHLLAYQNWRDRVWNPACVAVGIGDWAVVDGHRRYGGATFHDLRRSNATILVAEGVDVKTAQSRLGHSDIRMTLEVYARATTEADRAAAEIVGERFLPGTVVRDVGQTRG